HDGQSTPNILHVQRIGRQIPPFREKAQKVQIGQFPYFELTRRFEQGFEALYCEIEGKLPKNQLHSPRRTILQQILGERQGIERNSLYQL
ncbi:hypothetical protein HK102_011348, partial [Quaeritorhiza haematococci]